MYKDENIKTIVDLMKNGRKRHINNIIWRSAKKGISKTEVVDAVALLLDLKIITTTVKETGDGWNTIGKDTFFQLLKK